MIHPGDRLENPVTCEVLVFHRTSAQTNGDSVLVETIVRPKGFVAAAHVHPHQTERFEVIEGLLGLRIGEEQLLAGRRARPTASGMQGSTKRASSARCAPHSRSSP